MADTVSATWSSARQYLNSHPAANQVVMGALQPAACTGESDLRGYFTANPGEYYDLKGILSPIGDKQRQCNVTVLPPQLASAYDTVHGRLIRASKKPAAAAELWRRVSGPESVRCAHAGRPAPWSAALQGIPSRALRRQVERRTRHRHVVDADERTRRRPYLGGVAHHRRAVGLQPVGEGAAGLGMQGAPSMTFLATLGTQSAE